MTVHCICYVLTLLHTCLKACFVSSLPPLHMYRVNLLSFCKYCFLLILIIFCLLEYSYFVYSTGCKHHIEVTIQHITVHVFTLLVYVWHCSCTHNYTELKTLVLSDGKNTTEQLVLDPTPHSSCKSNTCASPLCVGYSMNTCSSDL